MFKAVPGFYASRRMSSRSAKQVQGCCRAGSDTPKDFQAARQVPRDSRKRPASANQRRSGCCTLFEMPNQILFGSPRNLEVPDKTLLGSPKTVEVPTTTWFGHQKSLDLPDRPIPASSTSSDLPDKLIPASSTSSDLPDKLIPASSTNSDLLDRIRSGGCKFFQSPNQTLFGHPKNPEVVDKLLLSSSKDSDLPERLRSGRYAFLVMQNKVCLTPEKCLAWATRRCRQPQRNSGTRIANHAGPAQVEFYITRAHRRYS